MRFIRRNSESSLDLVRLVRKKHKFWFFEKKKNFKLLIGSFVFILSFYLINHSEGQINYFSKIKKKSYLKTRDIFFDVNSHNLIVKPKIIRKKNFFCRQDDNNDNEYELLES